MSIKKRIGEILEIGAEPAIGIASEMLLSGAIGTIVPGAVSVMMNYRQVRAERNIERFAIEYKASLAELNEKIEQIDTEGRKRIEDICLPIALDYATDTKQEEKIRYIVNGFSHAIVDNEFGEDIQLVYYDMLERLSVLELRILRIFYRATVHSQQPDDHYRAVMEEHHINEGEYRMIREKLAQHGLLDRVSKNENKEGEALAAVQKTLEQITNGKKVDRYRPVKPAMTDSVTYRITPFGRKFMAFFSA